MWIIINILSFYHQHQDSFIINILSSTFQPHSYSININILSSIPSSSTFYHHHHQQQQFKHDEDVILVYLIHWGPLWRATRWIGPSCAYGCSYAAPSSVVPCPNHASSSGVDTSAWTCHLNGLIVSHPSSLTDWLTDRLNDDGGKLEILTVPWIWTRLGKGIIICHISTQLDCQHKHTRTCSQFQLISLLLLTIYYHHRLVLLE